MSAPSIEQMFAFYIASQLSIKGAVCRGLTFRRNYIECHVTGIDADRVGILAKRDIGAVRDAGIGIGRLAMLSLALPLALEKYPLA
jgi:hypothetical protein